MLGVTLICTGRMKEPYYIAAAREYEKRLGAYCALKVLEIDEIPLPAGASPAEVRAALSKQARDIERLIPSGAQVWALCVEGEQLESPAFSERIARAGVEGTSRLCFLIGGSEGLHEELKSAARFRLSMSEMTFPHHLARVMLLEQLYRAFQISSGGKYHK